MTTTLVFISVMLLAYANGANDNFKGVATLYGSGTTAYRRALYWATWATAAGSLCSLLLANGLLVKFSGKGLAPDTLIQTPSFLFAVAAGAGLTVLSATRLGLPVSTTHALLGAIVGAALPVMQGDFNALPLLNNFVLPLLLSPLLSVLLAIAIHWAVTRKKAGKLLEEPSCLCVEPQNVPAFDPQGSGNDCMDAGGRAMPGAIAAAYPAGELIQTNTVPALTIDAQAACASRNATVLLGFVPQRWLDGLHYVSAGCVCFARGLNDTPKIAALLWLTPDYELSTVVLLIALAMLLGGLFNARRVAATMSHKITTIDHNQGLAANAATALLVIVASRYGVPVSTTHVAVGALFGIGLVNRAPKQRGMATTIILSWLLTLPCAAVLAGLVYTVSRHFNI